MTRILFALVALIMLLLFHTATLQAQQNAGPAAAPQETNAPEAPKPPSSPEAAAPDGIVYIAEGEVLDTVVVRDRPLILLGQVTHDVIAINSPVTIERSGKVGGRVLVTGGSVTNRAGKQVRVVQTDRVTGKAAPVYMEGTTLLLIPASLTQAAGAGDDPRREWLQGQLALLLVGLVGGLVALIAAPRATQQCATFIALEPARCLVIGGIAAALALVAAGFNAILLNSPVRLLYAPFGMLVLGLLLLPLAFGWLCGMRYAGDIVARRLGKTGRGGLYSRLALGLTTFFFLNWFLGSLHGFLGACGLLVQFIVALMGLGALIITGFGRDPDWLGARLRGESRWFAWKRR
jgi:hypothetical protein